MSRPPRPSRPRPSSGRAGKPPTARDRGKTGAAGGSGSGRGASGSATGRGKAGAGAGSSRGRASGAKDRTPSRDRAGGAKDRTPARGRSAAGADRTPSRGRTTDARDLGGDQVEGRQAVRELLLAGLRRPHEILLANDLDPAPIVEEITALATELRVPIRAVSRARLEATARTDAPQGVVARAAPLPEADLDDLARTVGAKVPFLVVVDGVTDPGNLGALYRAAECSGVTGFVLPRHRAAHVTAAVTKAAAGAIEYVPTAVVPGLPTALARLKELGVWTVGLDAGGRQPLDDLSCASDPIALVLGAEGKGLSRLVRDRCDLVAAIPLRGRLGSLNVAAAGAIACYEVARQRGWE